VRSVDSLLAFAAYAWQEHLTVVAGERVDHV
jgi:hypothetical protein